MHGGMARRVGHFFDPLVNEILLRGILPLSTLDIFTFAVESALDFRAHLVSYVIDESPWLHRTFRTIIIVCIRVRFASRLTLEGIPTP